MTKASLGIGTALVIVGVIATAAGSAQVPERAWSISVQIDSTKPDGSAWDAFGGAPDIALCGTSSGGAGCVVAEGTVARCQDAFSCSFSVSLPETFSASLWDLDLAADDLVGTCYIDHPGTYRCGSATVTAR